VTVVQLPPADHHRGPQPNSAISTLLTRTPSPFFGS
jgi:hypothetical protein